MPQQRVRVVKKLMVVERKSSEAELKEERKCVEAELSERGSSLLHSSAYLGNEREVRRCLANGNDVNARDKDGRTAVFCAVVGYRTNIVRMLLKAGANPSYCFPLYIAVQQRETAAIARALIEAKADLNAVLDHNTEGTALLAAVRSRQKAMVKLLIDAGCDLWRRATEGCQPLTAACEDGLYDIAEMLLDSGAQVNGVNSNDSTALEVAARCRQCDIINLLCERGAWLDHKGWHGRSAVYAAVEKGFPDVIKLLSAAGANLDFRDDSLHAPLHFASQLGECECVRALLCEGANIAALDSQGRSPLHTASAYCQTDVIEILLSGGADVRAKDGKGYTPLAVAVLARDAFRIDPRSGEVLGPPVGSLGSG